MEGATDRFGVLFVCMGNICRSPAGEAVFRHLAERAGLGERLRIGSAGTTGYHRGEPADARMRAAAARRGYQLASRARQVHAADLEHFDLVVAMDEDNLRLLQRLAGRQRRERRDRLTKLGRFLVEAGDPAPDVPDPYHGDGEGFERVLDMLEAACPRLLEHCRARLADG